MMYRPISRPAVEESIERQEAKNRLFAQTFLHFCIHCEHCKITPHVVTAEAFRIVGNDDVKKIVLYETECKHRRNRSESKRSVDVVQMVHCVAIDVKCTDACRICKYAEPVLVDIEPGEKAEELKDLIPPAMKGVRTRRIFYKCTHSENPFDSDTYMSSYCRCEHFESIENPEEGDPIWKALRENKL